MGEIIYQESSYRFTQPVRYFKENDPYYWEVDNIPIKQLEENVLWLKDQIGNPTRLTNVERADINELRPYANSSDNIIKVKPGRYTARINDAYNLTPLQVITQLLGQNPGDVDVFKGVASDNTALASILERAKSSLAANALNLNGLIERTFVYPFKDADFTYNDLVTSGPTINWTGPSQPPYPISEYFSWYRSNLLPNKEFVLRTYNTTDGTGFISLSFTETFWIKKWRGVARTAVVDVPDELEIIVPPFNEEDHFYIDESGNKVKVPATQRIDLLFIYSKPIDTSSTTVAKYVNNQPTTITKAQLGILKGAGIGVSFKENPTLDGFDALPAIDADGTSKMLSHHADENGTTNGFTRLNIHGSFPAPDDLLNITPVLSEKLEATSYLLVGQSILPLAYIRVRKEAATGATGQVISTDDVIDIRPFLRTTELSYNERAGIAAAFPSLSFANPAVGKSLMDYELRRVHQDLIARINQRNEGSLFPRVVGAGYVFGGAYYGIEGAIIDYYRQSFGANLPWERLKREVIPIMALPQDVTIPNYPDWDLSRWCEINGDIQEKGEYPNDRVDLFIQYNGNSDIAAYSDKNVSTKLTGFGTDNIQGRDNKVTMYFCKKKINIDRAAVPWMKDYMVVANYLNCVPLCTRQSGFQHDQDAATAGLWIDKRRDSFTIYSSWVANDINPARTGGTKYDIIPGGTINKRVPLFNREGHWYAGFVVSDRDIASGPQSNNYVPGISQCGVAIYPTIYFQIIGIPANYDGYSAALNGTNPILKLT